VSLSVRFSRDYGALVDINVNGQSYSRWEDVPPEVRQQLAATLPDADRNGIPDLLEGNLSGLPIGTPGGVQAFTSISVNGQTVGSVGELPPEVQEVLRQAFGWPATAAAAPPAAAPPAAAPPAAAPPAAAPPAASGPLQPGQVMLNGVPTDVSATAQPRKSWWRRLFGG
jgi:hypothetical protein